MPPLPKLVAVLAAVLSFAALPIAQAQTVEEMAGQMIVVGFSGDSVDDAAVKAVRAEIAAGEIGGVMYLRTNVASLRAVKAMNAAFRDAAPPSGLLPFITLDQEGGSVERLTEKVGFKEVPNAATVAKGGPAEARRIYNEMARGVADVGFSVNFGPVVDLNINPDNQIIAKYGRAFSDGANLVTVFAEQFIAAHHQVGLLTAIKHFPGHGSSAGDSHEGYVDITRTWQDKELSPYRQLIDQGVVDMVMVGHLTHTKVAPSGLPSSLAPEWITGVLRDDLGFKGVVISDDLEMGAIREHYSLKETVVRAVNAGMDILLFSNTAKPRASLSDEIRAVLVAEAERDPAFAARIAESYQRIVALKSRIGD